MHIAVSALLLLLSQRCHCQRCNITISTIVVIALYSSSPLPQCYARLRCHNAVLVCAVTTLCSFSLSQRCACFRCHSATLVSAVTTPCTSVSTLLWGSPCVHFPFDGKFNILGMVRNIFSVFTRMFLTAELICFFCQVQLFAKCKHPAESWCRPDPGQQSGHDPPALCGQEGHQANGQTVSRPQRCRYQRSGQFLPYTVAPRMYPWQQSSCSVTAQQERRREGNVR